MTVLNATNFSLIFLYSKSFQLSKDLIGQLNRYRVSKEYFAKITFAYKYFNSWRLPGVQNIIGTPGQETSTGCPNKL